MFRLTELLSAVHENRPVRPHRDPPGPVVIWNLTRRCNLKCKHCYTVSDDRHYPGELTTVEILRVMGDLKAARVPALILSGGEPLLHPDIWKIAEAAVAYGFYTALSTNGTRIDEAQAKRAAAIGFDYVGISLDGLGERHDRFRGEVGSFDAALEGIRRCVAEDVRVGMRLTLTEENRVDMPGLLELMHREGVEKFYLSHLNYGGRGNVNRTKDAVFETTRLALELLFETAWADVKAGAERVYTTGNNDADGVYLYHWVREHLPEHAENLLAHLESWGGNSSGVGVSNIDNLGNVHPDTFWWDETIGSVRERAFADIWADTSHPLMAGLKQRPRPVEGRCAECAFLTVCNGNTRVRAKQLTGNPWAEDPGCYLSDAEIGVAASGQRVPVRPFRPSEDAADSRFAATLRAR